MCWTALLHHKVPPHDWPVSDEVFFHGEMLLRDNTRALLGTLQDQAAGRIMVTLPAEAAHEPEYMTDIVRRGADVVRINCAHDGPEDWTAMIAHTIGRPTEPAAIFRC